MQDASDQNMDEQPKATGRAELHVAEHGSSQTRLDRVIPLIRDLLTWDLVERTEPGSYRLRDDVQRWLETEASRQGHPSAAVFIGRSCERCGVVAVTRLVDGARTCAPCGRLAKEAVAQSPTEPIPTQRSDDRRGRHVRRDHDRHGVPWRSRKVG